VFGLRTLTTFALAFLFLAPLGAEEEPLPLEVGFDWEDQVVRGWFTDQFFLFELEQNLETNFTDRIFMSWLAYGQDPDFPVNILLKIRPPMYASETSRRLGHDPVRWDEYYVGVHFLTDWADARLLLFGVSPNSSVRTNPHLELRRLRITHVSDQIDFIARGFADPNRLELEAGVDFQLFRNFNAKVLYGTNNLNWSVGFSTRIN